MTDTGICRNLKSLRWWHAVREADASRRCICRNQPTAMQWCSKHPGCADVALLSSLLHQASSRICTSDVCQVGVGTSNRLCDRVCWSVCPPCIAVRFSRKNRLFAVTPESASWQSCICGGAIGKAPCLVFHVICSIGHCVQKSRKGGN